MSSPNLLKLPIWIRFHFVYARAHQRACYPSLIPPVEPAHHCPQRSKKGMMILLILDLPVDEDLMAKGRSSEDTKGNPRRFWEGR